MKMVGDKVYPAAEEMGARVAGVWVLVVVGLAIFF
jgi:hypothetical protein